MKAIYDVPAPAKLNLFLHITGRRPDGYHLLQSVFMLIDWCDTLHFELRHDGRIDRTALTEPLPADDLAVRAARLLQQAGQVQEGAHISIDKQIPAQAGMGAARPTPHPPCWPSTGSGSSTSAPNACVNWRSGWAPMCRSSFEGATPGWKELVR